MKKNKILFVKIYKQLLHLHSQKNKKQKQKTKKNAVNKWVEELNRHFYKKNYTEGQQIHEKMLNITYY